MKQGTAESHSELARAAKADEAAINAEPVQNG